MKTTEDFKNWIGLAYWEGTPYLVDHFSSPDGWNYGFEIVYRLVFHDLNRDFINECRRVVKTAFGLPDSCFNLGEGSIVYWRIYWNQEAFDLNILKRCEMELDRLAERYKAALTIIGMFIIPRSIEHINQTIESHNS